MKVTFRLPSKTIQYGYAEVELELAQDSTSGNDLGSLYTNYVLDFQSGEIDAYNAYEKRAREAMESIGGKVVAVEDNPPAETYAESSNEASWTAPAPKAAPKPWETSTPKFNFGN